MFTGIIEEVGRLVGIHQQGPVAVLTIEASKVLEGVALGDSIAVNGTCLTVTSFTGSQFTADATQETLRRTNLGRLRPGTPVNLERACAVGSRLGGHWVTGHIDGTGEVKSVVLDGNAFLFTFRAGPEIMRYIVEKGSIAVDGISLTVASVDGDTFSVSVIPHTARQTTLKSRREGDIVNLETDILGKYVERFLAVQGVSQVPVPGRNSKRLDMDFLRANGFAE